MRIHQPITILLTTFLVSNIAIAHNADKLREERKNRSCDHLETLSPSALEKAGANAISRRKLCDAKRRLRESREKREADQAVNDQTSTALINNFTVASNLNKDHSRSLIRGHTSIL